MNRRFPPRGSRLPRGRVRKPFQVPPLLRQANRLMGNEKYAEAANAFEKVAERADARHSPRASLYYLRAGKALILAGAVEHGMKRLRKGLSLMASQRDCRPLQQLAYRTIDSLRKMGLEKEAEDIQSLLNRITPEGCVEAELPENRALLPAQCPHCGAPLHPQQVIWLDRQDAECPFCGNIVRGED